MSETHADLSIELNVTCPHCDEYFDLFEKTDLNDEGGLMGSACPNEGHWVDEHKKFKHKMDCPECGKKIHIEEIWW